MQPTDLDIMMFLDGELSGAEAEAVEAFLQSNADAKTKAAALGQVGEVVRTSVELAADEDEDKLAALWAKIDKSINSNGVSKEPERAKEAAQDSRATDALVERAGFFSGWQGHIITGAFAAAAVALVMYVSRPDRVVETQTVREQVTAPATMPVVLESQDPEIEALEVYDGTGVIMTIPGEDEDASENSSAVIWISNDTDVVEEPI